MVNIYIYELATPVLLNKVSSTFAGISIRFCKKKRKCTKLIKVYIENVLIKKSYYKIDA